MAASAYDQSTSSKNTSTALRNWELSNCIDVAEKIYRYDAEEQQAIRAVKPWEKDPHYFKEVKISAIALLKMVMHARSGGNLEIMGVIQGKIDANTIIIMDSFALPVEGTETTVNAQEQAYEYMSIYSDSCEPVGRFDKVVGWYHSHPGYGCWLSGIDVATQALHQQFQEPFLAIVIDPIRTISAGKVDLGAFRVYPKGYNPPNEPSSEYQSIPLNKIEDFGVHCKQYYQLEVTYFKSSLDVRLLESLWNTYWATTLSSNLLLTNASYVRGQVRELSRKMEKANEKLKASCRAVPSIHRSDDTREKCSARIIKDGVKLCDEVLPGLAVHAIKRYLFNSR